MVLVAVPRIATVTLGHSSVHISELSYYISLRSGVASFEKTALLDAWLLPEHEQWVRARVGVGFPVFEGLCQSRVEATVIVTTA